MKKKTGNVSTFLHRSTLIIYIPFVIYLYIDRNPNPQGLVVGSSQLKD